MMKDEIKYLVRKLTIINEKGEANDLSLFYIDGICENSVIKIKNIFKFDRERAGYEYVESLTIEHPARKREP